MYVVKPMKRGDIFTSENVRSIRPGFGMQPKYLDDILGKKATCDIEYGTALTKEMVGVHKWNDYL